jgi:hypothetical protein
MSFPYLVRRLRRDTGGPLEILGAFGHGRSYGAWSRLLFIRHLPGIAGCGLWQELERRPPARTLALVTDIGNDLGYGEEPETVATWVETCLERLERQNAEIVLTLLPIEALASLSPLRYHIARSILFPGRRVPSLTLLLERARELNDHLRRLALEHGAHLVEPEVTWYGIDPVHIRRRARERAWGQVLEAWSGHLAGHLTGRAPEAEHLPLPKRRALQGVRAAELRLLGRTIHTPQPAGRFAEGTTVALY